MRLKKAIATFAFVLASLSVGILSTGPARGAITTQDGLLTAMATATVVNFSKASLANAVAGQTFSTWTAAGYPTSGATPSTWTTVTSSTTGCPAFTNPTSPALTYFTSLELQPVQAATVIVYDRLAHMGGLSGTSTSAQTVSGTIPSGRGAAVNGSNVEWYLEWYTATGSTAATATITYTNQGDTTGRTTTLSLAATQRAGRAMFILPAAGDYIKSIQSVTLSASTLTAGSFGVTAMRRIASLSNSMAGTMITSKDAFTLGLPLVYDNACVFLMVLCSTTSSGIIQGQFALSQG